ncbi:uncharacterized protein IL334_003200 [Kwoniella shivajii]|uniref:ubiquitinyl hydrolase 1 n=1 Tax=Kwoniella shivajii TaxID=564305 RepID=A0ABZ1CWW2_9TREE|nr:hypothetical protein IL334_003200 [Kwoniella shivajii]
MTAEKPSIHHNGPAGPRSPRSPTRSHSLSSTQSQPYRHNSLNSLDSPASPSLKLHPRPAGPRSPDSPRSAKGERRDQPGSSRTRFSTIPLPITQQTDDIENPQHNPQPGSIDHMAPSSPSSPIELDTPHAPYRPPEAVIEPPEEHPPGYTPGIVAEHIGSDDEMGPPLESPPAFDDTGRTTKNIDSWNADVKSFSMDVDSSNSNDEQPRPQVGPGILPRRLLSLIHEHELVQPNISELPQPGKKASTTSAPASQSAWNGTNKSLTTTTRPASVASVSGVIAPPSPSPSTASMRSLPDSDRISTLDDVWDALPGQRQSHGEWYFCTTCWGWLRVTAGTNDPPNLLNMDEWEATVRSTGFFEDKEAYDKAYNDRLVEWSRLNDIKTSRLMAEETHHHFHEFKTLMESKEENRIEKVQMDENMNVFPHITFGVDIDDKLQSFDYLPQAPSRLYVSCSSDLWVQVDKGMIPGQIPNGLVQAFTIEKMNNPTMGYTEMQGVSEAWSLLATLLINPLFKGQRGWVKLDNPKFQKQIGATMTSSQLLHQIGFACQQEEDGLRVGPFKVNDEPSEEDKRKQRQMDQYMIRTWVEITLYLIAYQQRNDLIGSQVPWIQAVPLEDTVKHTIELDKYPKGTTPYGDFFKPPLHDLGVTKLDRAQTIEIAYGLQISCHTAGTPKYLGALEKVAEAPVFGKENLQMRVATERSLEKYTSDDVDRAYNLIGYTSDYAETLCVLPHEAPDSHILDLHKKAIQAATTSNAKQDIARALIIIGKERNSDIMRQLGETGQTLMSVQEAYSALNCPEDAIDDGLLMQYEMAVNEYPGKADHYKNCLSVIADAPGKERPGIKSFLETGSREPEAPPRKDIPVGLHNIGYLNSILQYLYSIKPLRDAVLSFEQDQGQHVASQKPDVERSKRFVRQLRLLFLQLYKSELPSVRPDEELAYLAITRPEVDAIVEPQIAPPPQPSTSRLTLDDIPDIPDIPSPSSTQVASPITSPVLTPVDNGKPHEASSSTDREDKESSILGKRASEDRDDSSRSSQEYFRHKSEGAHDVDSPTEMEIDDFELVTKPPPDSPSATMDLTHLDLKSPIPESKDEFIENFDIPDQAEIESGNGKAPLQEEEVKYDPPSVPPPLPPRPHLAKKDTLSSGLRFGLQQDSAEVLINVLSQLELALDQPSLRDGEKGSNLIQSLFSCKYHQQIIYETAASSSASSSSPSAFKSKRRESVLYDAQTPVESVFVHPIIGVEEEGKDLSDCLAELYLKGADIEYEGKKGYMMDLMDTFPDMLYIQMRRSQYDPATGRERKTNTHIPFDRTLSMGRFLVGADPQKREEAIELTREMVRIRTRLHQLRNHKPLSIPATFKHVASSLRQLSQTELELPLLHQELSTDFVDALDAEFQNVENEIVTLQSFLPELKKRMDEIWSSNSKKAGEAEINEGEDDDNEEEEEEWDYELVSVFMHRGKSSGSGHYWTYQSWLPDHGDTFFKYNDDTVTQVPSTEVLQDRTGDDANPALLCYVRKGKKLVDTLHREILQQLENQAQIDDPFNTNEEINQEEGEDDIIKEHKGIVATQLAKQEQEVNLIEL